MIDKAERLAMTLDALMAEMQRAELWSEQRPPTEAFQSTLPFFTDTMSFAEWLQFVLIERLSEMLRVNAPLPAVSGIAVMAEHVWQGEQDKIEVISLIADIDELLGA